MNRRRNPLLLIMATVVTVLPGISDAADDERVQLDVPRVDISLGFTGQAVFVHGKTPPATTTVISVVEAPPMAPQRVVERERRLVFWPAVRMFLVENMPGYYVVSLHDPQRNVLKEAPSPEDSNPLELLPAELGAWIGPTSIFEGARVCPLRGRTDDVDVQHLLSRFWQMQADAGLYAVRQNAIRITTDGDYYYSVKLPTRAPEGKYKVTSYFFSDTEAETGSAPLVVRTSGIVSVISRSATKRPLAYGVLSVLCAMCVGWLGGKVFGRQEGR